MSEPIYCPSMWKSVHVDVDSYLTPCCIFIHPDDKKTKITDVDRIETVLLDEFEPYRKQLSNGEWPKGCNQCKFAEEEGRASKRTQDINSYEYGKTINEKQSQSDPYKVQLEYLQLKTGRLCNLECTICHPGCSTSIATTHLKKGLITRERYDKLNAEIQWASNLDEYKKMNTDKYYRIDIAGGEPLMNKTHFKWLDQLENTQDTQLLYNTNGTFRPTEEEVAIWSKFRGVWISFSVDSHGKRFEELRVGAKWDEVLSNMKYITEEVCKKKLAHQQGYTNTAIVMTLHQGNIHDIFDLWEIVQKEIDWIQNDPINFNYLFYPESLAVHNMNKEVLNRNVELFRRKLNENILPEGSKIHTETINLLKSMESFLDVKKVVIHERSVPLDNREKLKEEDPFIYD